MKTATLIAIIAMAIQVLAGLVYLLQAFELIKPSLSTYQMIQPLYVLSDIGVLIFFIYLYQKQSKN